MTNSQVLERAVAGIIADKEIAVFDRETDEMERELRSSPWGKDVPREAMRIVARRHVIRPVIAAWHGAQS